MTPLEVARVMAAVRAAVAKAPAHEELFAAIEALLTFGATPPSEPQTETQAPATD